MIVTNRCGFSHHHFQAGGSCAIADDGTLIAKANSDGEEEMVLARFSDLYRLPRDGARKTRPSWATAQVHDATSSKL